MIDNLLIGFVTGMALYWLVIMPAMRRITGNRRWPGRPLPW